jgi:Na+-transporting methylmalonyl-CoA/oxaloacetate decarboxylase gamma subunit
LQPDFDNFTTKHPTHVSIFIDYYELTSVLYHGIIQKVKKFHNVSGLQFSTVSSLSLWVESFYGRLTPFYYLRKSVFTMSLATSLLVALFTLAVVFLVLTIIYFLIRIFSAAIGGFKRSPKELAAASTQEPRLSAVPANITEFKQDIPAKPEPKPFSAGIIKLNNVDEKSAAMVMAVVSHETGIPLSQLRFKSIRRIDE